MYEVDYIELRWPGPRYEVIIKSGDLQCTVAFFWKKKDAEEYCNFKNETYDKD